MPVDQHLLAEASAAAGRVTELEDQLEGAKADTGERSGACTWQAHRCARLPKPLASATNASTRSSRTAACAGGDDGAAKNPRPSGSVPSAARAATGPQARRRARRVHLRPLHHGRRRCHRFGATGEGSDAAACPRRPPDSLLVLRKSTGPGTSPRVRACLAKSTSLQPICDECLGLCGEILSEQLR